MVKFKNLIFNESTIMINGIEDDFQEERSNVGCLFSLFVNFTQNGQIPFVQHENQVDDIEEYNK